MWWWEWSSLIGWGVSPPTHTLPPLPRASMKDTNKLVEKNNIWEYRPFLQRSPPIGPLLSLLPSGLTRRLYVEFSPWSRSIVHAAPKAALTRVLCTYLFYSTKVNAVVAERQCLLFSGRWVFLARADSRLSNEEKCLVGALTFLCSTDRNHNGPECNAATRHENIYFETDDSKTKCHRLSSNTKTDTDVQNTYYNKIKCRILLWTF